MLFIEASMKSVIPPQVKYFFSFRPWAAASLAFAMLAGCQVITPSPIVQTAAPAPTLQPTQTEIPILPSSSPTAMQISTSTPKATPKPVGKIKILAWPGVQDDLTASGLLANFQAQFPGIQLEWTLAGAGEIASSLETPATSQLESQFDLAFVNDQDLPGVLSAGGLADLSDLLVSQKDSVLAYKIPLVTSGEKWLALPLSTDPAVLYYRKDIFLRAGLPADPDQVGNLAATWDGFLQVCRQIQEKSGLKCFANNRANNRGWLLQVIAWQSGTGYYDQAGKVQLNLPGLVDALSAQGPFWKEKLVADPLEWTNDWYNLLSDPKSPVATVIAPASFAPALQTWVAPDLSGDWGAVRIPALAKGQPRAASLGGTNLVAQGTAGDSPAVRAFIAFLSQPENSNRFSTAEGSLPAIGRGGETTGSPNAYFGGEDLGSLFSQIAGQIPPGHIYGKNVPSIEAQLMIAIRGFAAGLQTAQQALDTAQKEFIKTHGG